MFLHFSIQAVVEEMLDDPAFLRLQPS